MNGCLVCARDVYVHNNKYCTLKLMDRRVKRVSLNDDVYTQLLLVGGGNRMYKHTMNGNSRASSVVICRKMHPSPIENTHHIRIATVYLMFSMSLNRVWVVIPSPIATIMHDETCSRNRTETPAVRLHK